MLGKNILASRWLYLVTIQFEPTIIKYPKNRSRKALGRRSLFFYIL